MVAETGFEEDGLLRLAAAVEHNSEHPLASAIVREGAQARHLTLPAVTNFNAIPDTASRQMSRPCMSCWGTQG